MGWVSHSLSGNLELTGVPSGDGAEWGRDPQDYKGGSRRWRETLEGRESRVPGKNLHCFSPSPFATRTGVRSRGKDLLPSRNGTNRAEGPPSTGDRSARLPGTVKVVGSEDGSDPHEDGTTRGRPGIRSVSLRYAEGPVGSGAGPVGGRDSGETRGLAYYLQTVRH